MLTSKQQNVLKEIEEYIQDFDHAPSVRQLQDRLGIKSPRGVSQYLETLERKGYIRRNGDRREITLLNREALISKFMNIPILGYANCGIPMVYAEEERIGLLQVDRDLIGGLKNKLFALIAKGDSMNRRKIDGKNINDADYVIVSKDENIQNGDAVVAIVDECATIKTFKRDKDVVILCPESSNDAHQPIYISKENSSLIAGKVVAVLKNPKYLRKE